MLCTLSCALHKGELTLSSRETALKILYEVEKNGAYCDRELKKQLASADLSSADNSLVTELVYGVIKNKTRLDYIIAKRSSQPLKKLSVWILNILRLGIYQMEFLDKIPQSAAVNESVKLAKRYGHNASAGFVNGVLRGHTRHPAVKYPSGREYYEVYYSHPKWIVDMLFEQYGEQTATEIIIANNQTPTTTVRVNRLKDAGAEPVRNICGGNISQMHDFQSGMFTVQDISAYKASLALDPKKGQLIIDLCAAPGGKTTHIAEITGDRAEIVAFDIHPHKIELIQKNAARLGIMSIQTVLHDATELNEKYIGRADRVLADVPCSGLGIIRKKPDIKWTKKAEDIAELIKIQMKILQTGSEYVKAGGILVYSTCTLNKNENEGVVEAFIKNNPFEILEQKTILTGDGGGDGFHICKLKRKRTDK